MSNSRHRESSEIMATSAHWSTWEASEKAFNDNVVVLRDLIREAVWENDTLINTTQQHLSKLSYGTAHDLAEHSQNSTRKN